MTRFKNPLCSSKLGYLCKLLFIKVDWPIEFHHNKKLVFHSFSIEGVVERWKSTHRRIAAALPAEIILVKIVILGTLSNTIVIIPKVTLATSTIGCSLGTLSTYYIAFLAGHKII